MDIRGSKTERNLLKTFAGESRARNKYTFYADKAEEEGYEFIASIFLETAGNELAHAREVFKRYLGLVKCTAENLKDAAKGEAEESKRLYKEFESTARAEGFMELGDFYKELAEVEEHHMDRFYSLLQDLVSGREFKKDYEVKWQCMNCGYIHVGKKAPEICPLCKYPQSYFKVKYEEYGQEG